MVGCAFFARGERLESAIDTDVLNLSGRIVLVVIG